jgi:uncharacterized damage-inducible protein DinB
MVRVQAVLDSWKAVRADSVQAVEDFPLGELDFRPTDGLMSFREIATHILQAGAALTGLLLDGVEHLNVPEFREMLKKYLVDLPENAGPELLAAELRRSLEQRYAQLAAETPEFYARMMTRMDGQRVTRLEMLQFVKEHELTHRAQLFLYLRLKGLVPPTTRRRQAKK